MGSEGRTDAQGPRGARDDGGSRTRGPTDAAAGLTPAIKHTQKQKKKMKDNQQTHPKAPRIARARLFFERGSAFLPSFPQPSGEY